MSVRDDQDDAALPDEGRTDGEEARLRVVLQEARAIWLPRQAQDETEAERRLMARVAAYESEQARRPRFAAGFWAPVGFVTAVAAAALVFSQPKSEIADGARASSSSTAVAEPARTAPRPTAPARLARVAGGDLQVNGVATRDNVAVKDGQTLETRGGIATFEAPGRSYWLLESGTAVEVSRAGALGGAIVLALEVGAVEAQVTPVAAGEAFAVDVDSVRVAVHGTHLRVARAERNGARITVDLTEGTILVGAPPKAGTTLGHQIVAPAHVEFLTSDLEGTLQVSHEASRVRAAVDPASIGQASDSRALVASDPPPESPPVTSLPTSVDATSGPGPRGTMPPIAKPLRATESIALAVRACADQTLHGGTGSVTISSVLTVDLRPDGGPRFATFEPPLAPDLQTCVANKVYAMRFTEPGPIRVPIELHR